MIHERLTNYIRSLEPDRSPALEKIRKEALAAAVPILRDETAALLKSFIILTQPERILEIGTATGYSALTMAEKMPESARLLTVESYAPRCMQARKNIDQSPYADRIELREADAGAVLSELAAEGRSFDFVFLDAAKAQYMNWLPLLLRLLPKGGVLLSDNILQEGSLMESRFLIERRDRTIHARMREYLYALKHTEELETAILTVGDGVSFSVKR